MTNSNSPGIKSSSSSNDNNSSSSSNAKPIQIVIVKNEEEENDPLEVPEEPAEAIEDARKSGSTRSGTPLSFFTAAKIATWMARAYGYVAKKKAAYNSQDKVSQSSVLFTGCFAAKLKSINSFNFFSKVT